MENMQPDRFAVGRQNDLPISKTHWRGQKRTRLLFGDVLVKTDGKVANQQGRRFRSPASRSRSKAKNEFKPETDESGFYLSEIFARYLLALRPICRFESEVAYTRGVKERYAVVDAETSGALRCFTGSSLSFRSG